MNPNVSVLASILEAELALGAQLDGNLQAQKKALIAWDVAGLVGEIEKREEWLRQFAELEERRRRVLGASTAHEKTTTLRQIAAALPEGSAQKYRLLELREQVRNTFFKLQIEERNLHVLMRDLLSHIQEALRPLGQTGTSTYGESGVAEPHRPATSLLQSRA